MELSIIIPAYNSGDYIEDAIKSCPLDRVNSVEVIVVDDGSTDNTSNIVARICENFKAIKYYKIENHGLSYARNYGMEKALGEYILFLDSDDILYPDVIQKGMKISNENMIDVWYYRANEIDTNGICLREQSCYPFSENVIYTGKRIMAENPKHFIRHEAWRGVYRLSFLKKNNIRFIDELYYEDNTFWFDIMCKSERIIYTNEIGYGYRIREGSIINSSISLMKIISVFRICEYLLEKETEDIEYWNAIPGKIAVLIRNCECKLHTSECESVLPFKLIIEKKIKLSKLIDIRYSMETIEGLKFNYFLSSYIYLSFGILNDYLERKLEDIREKLIRHLGDWVNQFNISSGSVVAFYGSGPNGDVIHQTIEMILGRSLQDWFYIDSNLQSLENKHNGKVIVNIDDIEKYRPDMIIVSSFLYEDEIVDSLKRREISCPWYACYSGSKCSYDGMIVHNFYETYRRIKNINGRKIYLLLTPEYSNLGDHLIALAEYQFINQTFPNIPIIEITNEEYRVYKSVIRTLITPDDYLVITGGGYFGTLWREGHYDEVLDITDYYETNKIFMMPQSIFFSEDNIGDRYKKITKDYLGNKNIFLCLRERLSYNRVRDIQPSITIIK